MGVRQRRKGKADLVPEGDDRHEHGLQVGGMDAVHEGAQQPTHAATLTQPAPEVQLQHHGHQALLAHPCCLILAGQRRYCEAGRGHLHHALNPASWQCYATLPLLFAGDAKLTVYVQ